ncbi:MAG TPA: hypothetical protein CFH84_12280 [Sulfurimonas sp. UBA12504]|nr:MAG TPA: hypothetical protein CFH84_12280 [Sulfurimonas sp. UBA12504]
MKDFKKRLKEKVTDFTREKKLGFMSTLNIMLKKSSKTLSMIPKKTCNFTILSVAKYAHVSMETNKSKIACQI